MEKEKLKAVEKLKVALEVLRISPQFFFLKREEE